MQQEVQRKVHARGTSKAEDIIRWYVIFDLNYVLDSYKILKL